MTMPQFVITVITIVLLFFGSLIIVFFTQISLLLLPLYWLLVIIPAQYLYSEISRCERERQEKESEEGGGKGGITIFERQETVKKQKTPPKGAPEEKQPIQKSAYATEGDNPILFRAKTLWPFDPFPDELIIKKETISFIRWIFFSTFEEKSINFKNVQRAVIIGNPLFSVLRVEVQPSKGEVDGEKHPQEEAYQFPLASSDAEKAKEIIDAIMLGPKGKSAILERYHSY